MRQIIALILGVSVIIIGAFIYNYNNQGGVGADLRTFISVQLAGSPANGECLFTDGVNNYWDTCASGGGGSSKWTDGGSVIYPTNGESIEVSSIAATGTATSTFVNLEVSGALNLFGTIGSALSDFCVAITGGSGLCDGSDDGGSGGGLATTTPWTTGNLVQVTDNGTVNSIATSSLGLPTFSTLDAYLSTTSAAATYYLASNPAGYTTNTGTVTSVAQTVPTGFTVTGSPVTTTGTLAISYDTGYGAILTASTTEWSSFYATPSSRITAGDALTWSGNTLNFDGGNSPGGELGGTWASPTLDDSLAVTGWNLTTPTLTSFFGTPCTGNDFLQDISDTGAFTCVTAIGGGSGDTAWATTTLLDGATAQYPVDPSVDILFGGNSTSTAGFWYDDSASTTRFGDGGAGDSLIELAISGVSKWIFGADDDDSDAFVISSGGTLGTNNIFKALSDRTIEFFEKIFTPFEIVLDSLVGSDERASGFSTEDIVAGEDIDKLELLVLDSSGEFVLADADDAATSTSMMAVALESASSSSALNVALAGSFVRDDTWNWASSTILYASTTAGVITDTAPTGTDDVVRVIGYATSPDVIYFNPSGLWIVLE